MLNIYNTHICLAIKYLRGVTKQTSTSFFADAHCLSKIKTCCDRVKFMPIHTRWDYCVVLLREWPEPKHRDQRSIVLPPPPKMKEEKTSSPIP